MQRPFNRSHEPRGSVRAMRERYRATIEVVDESGRVYELEEFVTLVDGREGAPFYRLRDGIPARRIGADEFEIGMVDKVRVKRR
jgi:hypothetical protein